jgi:hypothetical protein
MTEITPLILTWRQALLGLLPRWLRGKRVVGSSDPNEGFYGHRISYGIGVVQDAAGTALKLGLMASYPGQGDATALALTGAARGILRGPSESDEAYAERLRFWRQVRRRQGNAFALMEQLQAYLQPYGVAIRVQYDDGTRYQLDPHGYLQVSQGYAGTTVAHFDTVTWNWDGTPDPARFWVILCDTEETLWVSDGTWATAGYWWDRNTDDATWSGTSLDPLTKDTGPTYGSTASYAVVQGLLSIIADWTPPHANFMGAIWCFDESSFNSIAPDGTWGNPGNRSQNYVYWNN